VRGTPNRFTRLPLARSLSGLLAVALLAGPLCGRMQGAGEGQLVLTVVDEKTNTPIPCRMHLIGPGKKPRKVEGAPFWNDHFVFPGTITLKLPVGKYTFEVQRGPEYLNRVGNFAIEHFADDAKQFELRRFVDMSAEGWWSGDLCVRRPERDAALLMAADDLHVAELVTWWNGKAEPANRAMSRQPLVCNEGNRCYDAMAGGFSMTGVELLCFRLPKPLTANFLGPEYPPLVKCLAEARRNSSLWVDLTSPYCWDLPLLVAHGQVDSIEVLHSHYCRDTILADDSGGKPRDRGRYPGSFGYARWSQDVYFRLLDCGLRIPPSAGSGSGVAPNPVGYNRVYVHIDGDFSYDKWWQGLRAGQAVITNGPLLRPTVHGQLPGYVFQAPEGQEVTLEIGVTLSTTDPISYLDIIQDGRVKDSIRFEDYAKTGRLPPLQFKRSGWFMLRAVTEVPNTYRFAMTAPYYVEIGPQRRISKAAVQFFLDWVYERARQIKLDDPQQRREVLEYHRKARDFWQDLLAKANAE
jgi:hypothetical protein